MNRNLWASIIPQARFQEGGKDALGSMLAQAFQPKFPVELVVKDLSCADLAGKAAQSDLPVTQGGSDCSTTMSNELIPPTTPFITLLFNNSTTFQIMASTYGGTA